MSCLTVFRVSEADFDNMPMREVRKIMAQLVRDKLWNVYPEAIIRVGNEPNEGDPEVLSMIAFEMRAILGLLPGQSGYKKRAEACGAAEVTE